jgi:hypothetical protein
LSRYHSATNDPGRMTMLTAIEQDLTTKAERALSRLEAAKRGGDAVAIAQARVAAVTMQVELAKAGAANGSGAMCGRRWRAL